MGVAQGTHLAQVLWVIKPHPARALRDGFQNDRRQFVFVQCDQVGEFGNRRWLPGAIEPAGRPRREELLRDHPGEQAMHAGDRIAHRHGPEGVAMIPPAQGQQPALGRIRARLPILNRHLDGDLDGHRARVAQKDLVEGVWGEIHEAAPKLDRWRVRKPPKHHMRHAPQLLGYGMMQDGVIIAVNRRPPRTHAVDELPAVGERQSHAMGLHHRPHRRPHRRIGMPEMGLVECHRARPIPRRRTAGPGRDARYAVLRRPDIGPHSRSRFRPAHAPSVTAPRLADETRRAYLAKIPRV